MLYNIKQHGSFTLLGVTLQGDCKFSKHIKNKLVEANKCLYIIRSLRKEGYTQEEIDHLFDMIVLPKLLYGLSVYAATVQQCKSTTVHFNISELLEKSDRRIFSKIKDENHPLNPLIPRYKESSLRLRNRSSIRPKINTERFKKSFFNRLIFKYNLAV